MRGLACGLACSLACGLALGAAPRLAAADDPPQFMISPLTGSFSGSLEGLPRALTEEIHRSFRERGVRAEIASAPFTDTAAIVGCDPNSTACLDRVASTLNVAKLLYGHVAPGAEPDTVVVSVALFTRGEPLLTREYALRGADIDSLVAALSDTMVQLHADRAPALDVAVAAPPRLAPEPGAGGAGVAGVDRWTWGLVAAGAALAGAGSVGLLLAEQRQDQIDSAPTDSAADFRRLAELERSGRARARWGTGLLLAGSATVAVGAVLAIRQASGRGASERSGRGVSPDPRSPAGSEEEPEARRHLLAPGAPSGPSVRLLPLPLAGGLGVALTVEGLP